MIVLGSFNVSADVAVNKHVKTAVINRQLRRLSRSLEHSLAVIIIKGAMVMEIVSRSVVTRRPIAVTLTS